MANEEIKQRINDFLGQSKGKTEFYLSDLTRAVPEFSKKGTER